MSDPLATLPESLRPELKDPLGPLFTDPESLLSAATPPLVAVGDIVTYHLLDAGYTPAVALVDDRTKRSAVDDAVHDAVLDGSAFDRRVAVDNPAGSITEALVSALLEALGNDETTLIVVDGEEDLAALPAVVAAPEGASVVYGQPDEGMVLVTAAGDARERSRSILSRMDGDPQRLLDRLDGAA
ncbi:DUF359 domain-containing protein [Halapricum sp. CBA1109]|uniref:GTP-dependent dephospho-CoA kinase family protein n=1 Tax=Halapricum sp. CBA1109 TaxID=2668068 RepID=UPI0013B6C285|nr:DUF359 domain-containing protein [Halapricum sp. CBA1109]